MRAISEIIVVLLVAAALYASDDGIAAFKEGRFSEALIKLKDAKNPTGRAFLALSQAALGDCKSALPGLTADYADPTLSRLTGLAAVKCDKANAFARIDRLEARFPNDPDVLY